MARKRKFPEDPHRNQESGWSRSIGTTDRDREFTREAMFARTLLHHRRRRDAAFPAELFGEPAWDMLLILFVAHEERSHVSVSQLCAQIPVPATTAHRWMLALVQQGIAVRIGDPHDRRRSYVYLSGDALRRMRLLLRDMVESEG